MSDLCLRLLCPAALEESLCDLLLGWPGELVFSSRPASLHGLNPALMNNGEQVLGRIKALQIELIASADICSELIAALSQRYGGRGLRYWTSPVNASGEIK